MPNKVWTQSQMDKAADDWQNRVFAAIDGDVDDGLNPEALAGCQHAGENLCRELSEAVELLTRAKNYLERSGMKHFANEIGKFTKRNTGGA